MADVHMNNSSQNETYTSDDSNINYIYNDYNTSVYRIYNIFCFIIYKNKETYHFINYVVPSIIISVCLPLTLMAIYALFSLITQIPSSAACVSLCYRYLVIVWPLWYRNRRTIKSSVVVCVVAWFIPFVFFFLWLVSVTAYGVFFLLPFPLLIFFLVGTIKALSAAISVSADEKRQIVGLLVLVLLIYTLLFLPDIICMLVDNVCDTNLCPVSSILFKLSPLADLFLYIFLRKGAVNKVLSCLCCCRKDRTSQQSE